MRRDTLQEVELDGPATAPDPPQGRRRLWVGVGVLAVILALASTQAVLSAREDAAVERLRSLPGVLRPVDDTLDVVRRLTVADAVSLTGEAGGALSLAKDGALTYHWFAPDDAGWSRQLLPATPTNARETVLLSDSTCEPDGAAADAHRVVCLVTEGAQVMSDRGGLERRPAETTEIVVLDTADGSTLARWPLDHGTSASVFPDDLVVVASATDAALRVTGHDALTGTPLWTLEEPSRPAPGDVQVFHAGDLVAVAARNGALRLLSRDGATVRDDLVLFDVSPEPGSHWAWSTAPDGGLAILGQSPDGRLRSTLVAADGAPAADRTIDGEIVPAPVDDGSVPGLLLTGDGSLHAWDAETGRARWSADVSSTTNALVLRGRVFLTTSARTVVALDGRSGRVVWRSDELAGLTPSALLTDGAHVLVATDRTSLTTAPSLIAYDPAGGEEVFRTPYPSGVSELQALGHTLVAHDADDELVELG